MNAFPIKFANFFGKQYISPNMHWTSRMLKTGGFYINIYFYHTMTNKSSMRHFVYIIPQTELKVQVIFFLVDIVR